MGKTRKVGTILTILLVATLVLLPPITAFAVEAQSQPESDFTGGEILDVSGQSTNGHVTAEYAWLTNIPGEGNEIFVAFKYKDTAAAWGKTLNRIGYNGLEFDAVEGGNYWKFDKGENLTVNDQILDNDSQWLVVNFGVQTLSDPFGISLTFDAGGFDISFDVSIDLLTVTYDPNSGVGVLTDPNAAYDEGQVVTVLANDNAFTKAGYSFTGWNTEPDGRGTAYAEGDTFNMPNHDVVLYAQWAPRTLTITALDKSKVYGEEFTDFEYRVDGVDDDYPVTITSVTLASNGSAQNAGVGSYPIVPSNAIGAGLENYQLEYVNGTLTVTPRAIQVTADDPSKVYGDSDPALTYRITQGNLVGSDGFTGALTRQPGEDVGSYAIQQGTLALSGNYILTFVEGELEITPRAIQVTADDLSKVYGDSDPALTYQITQGNLVAGDGFTGALVRVPGEDVGTYAIQQGTLALSGNYILTFVPGKLQITQAELPKTGVNEYKYYILGLMAMLLGTIFSAKSKKLTN